MRLCSGAGCGRKVPDDARFCDECRAERGSSGSSQQSRKHTTSDRENYAFLYSGPRWQRLRTTVIKRDAFCKRCDAAVSEIVDHTVPVGIAIAQAQLSKRWIDPWAGFYLLSNLRGLCRSCHHAKTLEDKTHVGEWPDVVAIEDAAPKKVWTF